MLIILFGCKCNDSTNRPDGFGKIQTNTKSKTEFTEVKWTCIDSLINTIYLNKPNQTLSLLDEGCNLNENLEEFKQLIIWAYRNNHIKLADKLTSHKNADKLDTLQLSNLLRWSILNDNQLFAKRMIEKGANPNAELRNHKSLLSIAVGNGNFEMTKLLVLTGADVLKNIITDEDKNVDDAIDCYECMTVLHVSLLSIVNSGSSQSKADGYKILKFLISKIHDVNKLCNGKDNLLYHASLYDDMKLLDLLFYEGCKIEVGNSSALHNAVLFSNYEATKKLLEFGADPNYPNKEGSTPLLISAKCCGDGFGDGITFENRLKTSKILLQFGADPNMKNKEGESFANLPYRNRLKDSLGLSK